MIFKIECEQCSSIKQMHKYACDYLLSWFPKLDLYTAFSYLLNQLSEAFRSFTSSLFEDFLPSDCFANQSALASVQIIICSAKLNAKVGTELTDKRYSSNENLYYHGVKLIALAFRRLNKIPFTEETQITPAPVNDSTIFKEAWSEKTIRKFFGDKMYNKQDFFIN